MTDKRYTAPYSSFFDITELQDLLPFFVNFDQIPFELTTDHSTVNAYWFSEFCRLSYITSEWKIKEECKKINMDVRVFWNNNTEFLVAYDSEKVFVVARGTESNNIDDIITDIKAYRKNDKIGEVHAGFKEAVDQVWEKMNEFIKEKSKNKKLYFTGHSLGAGLATVAAVRFGRDVLYTFGSPRVGNVKFALYGSMLIPHYRYINNGDPFSAMPPPIFNWRHFGEPIKINSDVFVRDSFSTSGILSFFKKKIVAKLLMLFTVSKWALLDLIAEHNILSYNNYLREQLNLPPHDIPKDYIDRVKNS